MGLDEATLYKLMQERYTNCLSVMKAKGEQYSSSADRLNSFRVAATLIPCTPQQALWGMAIKHVLRLSRDICLDIPLNPEVLVDLHNYLYLLEALYAHTDY